MSESKAIVVEVEDILNELREENNRLLNELLFAQKSCNLFEKYRKCLTSFKINCNCDQNIGNKVLFDYLEIEFNTISQDLNEKIESKDKIINQKTIENVNKVSVNKCLAKNSIKIEKIVDKNLINEKNDSNDEHINQIEDKINYYENNDSNDEQLNQNEDEVNSYENNNSNDGEYDSSLVEEKITAKTGGYYWCKFNNCDFKSDDKSKVKKHINGLHAHKVPIVCDECNNSFWKPKQLSEHIKSDHIQSYDSINNKFKCSFKDCSLKTHSFRILMEHKKRHTGTKSYKCNYESCEWNFFTAHELKNHQKYSHSSEKPFVCDWMGCNARFKQNKYLTYHKFSHTGDMPFKCEWPGCDAGYGLRSALDVHKTSHVGLKTFSCDWPECGQKFRTNANLKNHYSIHTNEKPFTCDWPGCDSRFRLKAKLKSHKMVHQSGCDFVCLWPQCGKEFRSKFSLKLHIMSHKGEKPFKCEYNYCEMRFKDRRQMRKHFNRRHVPK